MAVRVSGVGLTAAALAKLIPVSPRTVAYWYAGAFRPLPSHQRRLDELGVELAPARRPKRRRQ